MRKILLAGAAALALTAAPSVSFAQDASTTSVQPPADSTSPEPAAPMSDTTTPAPVPDGTTTVTTTETKSAPVGSPDVSQKGKPQTMQAMTVQQKTTYATWPAQRQSDYQAWPVDYQTYYWTLTPEQQEGYWALTNDQRGQIYKMTPEQRATAWKSIQEQMAGQTPSTPAGQANPPGQGIPTAGVPNPQSANQAAQPAMPADQGYQGGPYKGALTPPPADAMSKSYPVCSRTVTDGCRNRGGK
ncbi:hypothetical protein HNO88_000189 [Novosphingobium chloroacetimidivorans]|uniref:Uncharacterized protein n=1 Tax=Novosphingobium chloroacetimidivorans TaxID=1428314 RepID=A0A7W7K5Z1_9SPHN|nr:hypothetical protein [Novosphingobium chloroacetimidivorans]MBB4856892.1 hypothetical protein [Novosphingobium chloroacetimidivorans]